MVSGVMKGPLCGTAIIRVPGLGNFVRRYYVIHSCMRHPCLNTAMRDSLNSSYEGATVLLLEYRVWEISSADIMSFMLACVTQV